MFRSLDQRAELQLPSLKVYNPGASLEFGSSLRGSQATEQIGAPFEVADRAIHSRVF